ncbi:MAG: carboxyl transferase [Lachnospiraceae bacterium]|nr:carboxyl transferase [Lachnospiraceae bacterium]
MSEGTIGKALPRIQSLLDENSFVALGGDGVVTGYGQIDGNLVFVYAQDPEVNGGSIGRMHAKNILATYEMAEKMGAPVIGLLDSSGVRLAESFDAMEAFGSIYNAAANAEGVIPQIIAVYGNCGGGLSTLAGLADFTFMVNDAKLYYSTPNTIPGNSAEKNNTAGKTFRMEEAGDVDFAGTDAEVATEIRTLITLLSGRCEPTDDLNRASAGAAGDACVIATQIADNNQVFEYKKGYAPDMFCGLARLGGITVGIFGNSNGSDTLSAMGAVKAADFVLFCDAFDIQLLSIANLTGYTKTVFDESKLPRAVARLVGALTYATVGRISLISGKAYGSAFEAFGSKTLGADVVFALTGSDIALMDAKSASKIADADFSKISGVENAKSYGAVDRIVAPNDLRKYLIATFDMLYTKKGAL